MSKNFFIIATVMMVIAILGGLFYRFKQHDSEIVSSDAVILNRPIIKWQEITITESEQNIAMYIHAPRIIISNNYRVSNEVNQAITRRIESLKDDFISAVSTAAEDNGETNILNVETGVLLVTPKLISLAFTTTEHLAGVNDNEPERTFIIFDLIKGDLMMERNELFRDDIVWSRAVKMMKKYLLADYQGDPSCDLLFAPKHNGFAASCIGIDWSRGGKHLSITGDIPMSMIQKFLAPSVLSDIIQ
ncbi:MAG: hypothetical protein WAX79_08340 [Candidatus Omnitrophota bacterium]